MRLAPRLRAIIGSLFPSLWDAIAQVNTPAMGSPRYLDGHNLNDAEIGTVHGPRQELPAKEMSPGNDTLSIRPTCLPRPCALFAIRI